MLLKSQLWIDWESTYAEGNCSYVGFLTMAMVNTPNPFTDQGLTVFPPSLSESVCAHGLLCMHVQDWNPFLFRNKFF